MPTRRFNAELEIDDERGVVYVHFRNPVDAQTFNTVTAIRIKIGTDERIPLDLITPKAHYSILVPLTVR